MFPCCEDDQDEERNFGRDFCPPASDYRNSHVFTYARSVQRRVTGTSLTNVRESKLTIVVKTVPPTSAVQTSSAPLIFSFTPTETRELKRPCPNLRYPNPNFLWLRYSMVPVQWQESDARMVKNAAEVRLRSFDTKIHKVGPYSLPVALQPDSVPHEQFAFCLALKD